MDLKEGIAIVTGGATGIGRAVAESLLKRGAKVTIADISKASGEATRDELVEKFGTNSVVFTVCDVRDLRQFENAFKLTKSSFGGLNILVNNAGVMCDSEIDSYNLIAINCTSVAAGTRLALKYIGKQNGGSGGAVVNVSSITALYDPWSALPSYCSSKAFVQRFSTCLGDALYYEPSGVRVMAVCPGITVTNLGAGLTEMFKNAPELKEANERRSEGIPPQKAESVGEGVAKVLEGAPSGTTWVVENDQPPQQVHMKVVKENYFLN